MMIRAYDGSESRGAMATLQESKIAYRARKHFLGELREGIKQGLRFQQGQRLSVDQDVTSSEQLGQKRAFWGHQ